MNSRVESFRIGIGVDGASCVREEVTALFVELRAPLLRYLRSLGMREADGEDVAQETFLNLYEHLRQGKPRDCLRGWVFRVGHNLALKRLTRAEHQSVEFDVADESMTPEELADWKARQVRIRNVVAALPERDRYCLLLRAEGLRYREIAEALEISLGSVAASLARSLDKLSIVERG